VTARPIFVVGYERSGTTLLQAMLGAHPHIAAPPELHFLLRIVELRDYYGDLTDDDNLRRAVHDTVNPPLEMLDGCGFDEEVLVGAARQTERSYRSLLHVVMDDFARRQGKPRWSEKTPGQTARAVLALCPDAQVVHIVRDPRDVVASALEAPWSSMPARVHAENWRAFVTDNARVGEESGPGTYLQVRYEDLSADAYAVLRDLTTFLGEPFDPDMVDDLAARRATVAATATWQHGALEAVDSSRAGTWRHRLPWRARAQVVAVTHRLLAGLGYPRPRPVEVVAGRLLNTLARSSRDPHGVVEGTPADRYRAVQAHLAATAARVRPSR
jgi:hypothetical protein